MTGLLVALGAAVGAALRFLAAHHLDRRFPWGTLTVNVAGSFLLGIFSGLALAGHAHALLGTGFAGALTTYSAFAVQTVALTGTAPGQEGGDLRRGAAYSLVTIGLALAACAAGFALGA